MTVRIAIVGTGGMANVHAESFAGLRGCKVVAACDIDAARARAFADKHSIPKAFGSLDDLLDADGFDAVSIVAPDAAHAPLSIACLERGKHVLCEKPLALNAADARKMLHAATRAGVVHMVNFSYRNWACIQEATRAIAEGEIGDVRHVEASYLQAWLASKVWGDWRTNPAWLWRLSSRHGSKGALGDVGVHIVDYATFPVGPVREVFCRLRVFPKAPGNRIGPYRLDANDSATLNVEFENGALGVIHTTRWAPGHKNRLALLICGTRGSIAMDSDLGIETFRMCSGKGLDTGTWREVRCKPVPTIYQRFVEAIRKGRPGVPDFARGLEVQEVLDACFESDRLHQPVRLRRKRA